MPSLPDTNLVAFIDNSEDRMVVEYDADWYEEQFPGIDQPSEQEAFNHLLQEKELHWTIGKVEYTGKSYILTFERLWV